MNWRIKSKATGRYIRVETDNTVVMIHNKAFADVFEGTRDTVDGICTGLKIGLEEDFEPEQIIHIQKPTNEQSKMDGIPAGD